MNLYELIGERLVKARQEQGIGQKVLASMLGYTTSAISQYETGKRRIPLTDLEQIAATLNRPLTYFLEVGARSGRQKSKGISIGFKEIQILKEAKKSLRKLKEAQQEIKKAKATNKKLESRVQALMARVAEQSQITNQTALLYNELKTSEAKVRKAEVSTATSKTIQDIAYQLNNPLTSLLGFIQLLISEIDSKKALPAGRQANIGDLKRLEINAKRCIRTMDQLTNTSF